MFDSEKMTVTEQEVTQYDRQIRLWGLEAQNRLRSSKILLFGLKPLGAEICKNLVLAGIGEISVCDSEPINEKVKRKYRCDRELHCIIYNGNRVGFLPASRIR